MTSWHFCAVFDGFSFYLERSQSAKDTLARVCDIIQENVSGGMVGQGASGYCVEWGNG